jgi:hypothetical protein
MNALETLASQLEREQRWSQAGMLRFEYGILGHNEEALIRSHWDYVAAGELGHALHALEQIKTGPNDERGAEALLLQAILTARLGRVEESAALFARSADAPLLEAATAIEESIPSSDAEEEEAPSENEAVSSEPVVEE